MVKSIKAVIPKHIKLMVSGMFLSYHTAPYIISIIGLIRARPATSYTGGVQPENVAAYLNAGATGFALGSTLYQPGLSQEELRDRIESFMMVYRQVRREKGEGGGPMPGEPLINPDSGFLGDPFAAS